MTPRILTILLAISLAINLFILGAMVGAAAGGLRFTKVERDHPPAEIALRASGLLDPRHALRALPEERRHELRRKLRAELPNARVHLQRSNDAYQNIVDIMAEPELDEAALRSAFDDLASAHSSMRKFGENAIINVILELSPEDRALLVEAARRDGPRRPAHPRPQDD